MSDELIEAVRDIQRTVQSAYGDNYSDPEVILASLLRNLDEGLQRLLNALLEAKKCSH